MATAKNKTICFKCNEDKITYPCEGCSQRFCLIDLTEHRQILTSELHHITNEYNEFKQTMNEQKENSQNDLLIEQINQWEIESIEKVQQKAQEYREIIIKSSQTCIKDIETKFNNLREQIKQMQKQNEFNEIDLNYLRNQLIETTQEFNNLSKISIKKESQSFINDISIIVSKKPKFNKWKQNAITVAGRNGEGQELNQLSHPAEIFVDKNKNIFIADSFNHRIVEWKYNANEGQIIAGGNGQGNRMNQLDRPPNMIVDQQNHSIIIADRYNRRVIQWLNQNQQILIDNTDCCGLAMDKNGFLYVSNPMKNEVRRWKMGEYNNEGIIVAGGNGQGNQLNQLNNPGLIFVDENQSVYVADWRNHRVMKWRKDAKEGTVMAGENGQGENLNQLAYPEAVTVDRLGQIYVADCANHRIMRWCEGKEEGEIIVGGNGQGNQSNQLNGPCGLSFDDEGNLYVADYLNNRIQKFEVDFCTWAANWAVLVAGSTGWYNYRHQADVCHAYQILHKNGIPDSNIIVMMYDDLAKNIENPTKGVIINHPDGDDVYGSNTKKFYACITCDPNDNVFIYFTDHGAVACESGSMLEDLLPNNINIYATTASNAQESSYACCYDDKRQTYLGDVYSLVWMEDSDAEDIVFIILYFEYDSIVTRRLAAAEDNSLEKQKLERELLPLLYQSVTERIQEKCFDLQNEFVLHKLYIMANLCEIGLFDFTIHQAIDQVCNERLHFDY
ncbi:unnamed protein product [Adineta steineri]|uniref:Uncharacterized protein n=1 Tax=Adineta steineri TaxID=433720 RepID=A0A813R5L0_9BILA|nr:unnamed protein product [Adineta steineri]